MITETNDPEFYEYSVYVPVVEIDWCSFFNDCLPNFEGQSKISSLLFAQLADDND